ncbi:hypothetical protein TrRE_jg9569, partial [Triparma retinervis]
MMDTTMSSYSSPLSFHTPSGNASKSHSLRNPTTGGTMRTAKDLGTPGTAYSSWTDKGSVYGTPGEAESKPQSSGRKRDGGVTVTLGMLNYNHILNCTEPTELEAIVEVLESKYHRRFPALLEAATKRYTEIVAGGGRAAEPEVEEG